MADLEKSVNCELDTSIFSPDKIRVILDNPRLGRDDYPFLNRVETMTSEELATYDTIVPSSSFNWKHYDGLRINWIAQEGYLLRERRQRELGRALSEDEYNFELAEEVIKGLHSEKFRAFYCLRYPERVKEHRHLDVVAA